MELPRQDSIIIRDIREKPKEAPAAFHSHAVEYLKKPLSATLAKRANQTILSLKGAFTAHSTSTPAIHRPCLPRPLDTHRQPAQLLPCSKLTVTSCALLTRRAGVAKGTLCTRWSICECCYCLNCRKLLG